MLMFTIGRVCVKTAGRDAGKKCVIVDIIDKNIVMIDGQTRRRKCSITHLEPLAMVLEIKKGADNKEVVAALKKTGNTVLAAEEKKSSGKKAAARPKKARASIKKAEVAPEAKAEKKPAKSAKPAEKASKPKKAKVEKQ
jgi:large subunit ribosomal protein L14e